MLNNKKLEFEVIYPNNRRKTLPISSSLVSEALDVIFKDICKTHRFRSSVDIWNWPGRKGASAKSLFALSTNRAPNIRSEMALGSNDNLLKSNATISAASLLSNSTQTVLQFYFIVLIYPESPYDFSPIVSSFILQQLTFDILYYGYITNMQFNLGEKRLEAYLIENESGINDLDEGNEEQATRLLLDISQHDFYGYEYFAVQHYGIDHALGIGMRGILVCRTICQQNYSLQPSKLPVPFHLNFREIEELRAVFDELQNRTRIAIDVKKGNSANKKRVCFRFLSKQRLTHFFEHFERIHQLLNHLPTVQNKSYHSDIEPINASNVSLVKPYKTRYVCLPDCTSKST